MVNNNVVQMSWSVSAGEQVQSKRLRGLLCVSAHIYGKVMPQSLSKVYKTLQMKDDYT